MRGVRRALRTRHLDSADLICLVLFIFYGMPLVYDWVFPFEVPRYFLYASQSVRTQAIYPIVLLSSVLLIKIGSWRRRDQTMAVAYDPQTRLVPMRPVGMIPFFVLMAWLLLLSPIPSVLLLSPAPMSYLTYATVVQLRQGATDTQSLALQIISIVCILALFGFFLIYWVRTRYTRSAWDPVRWMAIVLVIAAVWIHGKRSIILFVLIIIGFVNFLERRLRLRTVLLYAVLGLVGGYLYIGMAKDFSRTPMEYVRGDLSRDYTLSHVIHRSSWTGSNILPYRGATYVFFVAAYVPRAIWHDKPWTAPVYLTNDVFRLRERERLGWGFGLGFMEELIMNFGFLGLAFCLLIGKMCSWLDRFIYARSTYYAILWVPLVFGCIFASSVILKLVTFVVVPAIVLSPLFANRNSWIPLYPDAWLIPQQDKTDPLPDSGTEPA